MTVLLQRLAKSPRLPRGGPHREWVKCGPLVSGRIYCCAPYHAAILLKGIQTPRPMCAGPKINAWTASNYCSNHGGAPAQRGLPAPRCAARRRGGLRRDAVLFDSGVRSGADLSPKRSRSGHQRSVGGRPYAYAVAVGGTDAVVGARGCARRAHLTMATPSIGVIADLRAPVRSAGQLVRLRARED